MLEIRPLGLDGVVVLVPKRHGDHRGFFSETYNKKAFSEAGIAVDFVQDNHSMSADEGTIRGLHFQTPPFAQAKLVRVIRGSILDVVVDVRRASPTFGKWVSAQITAAGGEQILVPVGFAHGICTLEPDTEVIYKVSEYYSLEHDKGVRWDDPAIGIQWPLTRKPVLSEKDLKHPLLHDSPDLF
jgi:dTDP-4-dehydrorhamnose 3,5-epimerase